MEYIYSVYDRTAQEGSDLFLAKNHGVATRNFKAFLAKSPVNPDEYQLLCLGEYYRDDPVKIVAFPTAKAVALTED